MDIGLHDNRGNERPDRIVIEKHRDNELQAVCVLLFDSDNREHQIWFKESAEGYELDEHKAPTRQIVKEDLDIYGDIRDEACQFMDDREYFVEETSEIVVECKTCGKETSTGIAMNDDSFDSTAVMGHSTQCPKGHDHSYDKEDMYPAG